ncbi:MAG TPA: hypothetical protein VH371_12265 [Candidatus Limnocylindrales bacterium]|jgi:hypothetical protein
MLTLRVWIGLGAFLVACAAVGFVVAPRSNAGIPDQASVLSLAAMVAVGIERLIELAWTTLGGTLGGWWPLKPVVDAFSTVETQTNALLGPILADTQKRLEEARAAAKAGTDKAKQVDAALADVKAGQVDLNKQLAVAQSLAPGSERLALLAGIATGANDSLTSALDLAGETSAEIQLRLAQAQQAVDVAMTVAQSFSDNPARRITSILVGGSLGMLAAAFLGLNIFAAVLGPDAGYLGAGLGVIVTGFIIGLGSSPTHEAVKALQNYKATKGTMVEADVSAKGGDPKTSLTVSRGVQIRGIAPQPDGTRRIMLRGTQ